MSTAVRRFSLTIAGGALAVSAVAGALAYLALRSSLPRVEGEIALAGLRGRVEVIRDRVGIPHIVAGSIDDLFFTIGYLQAQDRLWQMELYRRTAEGRLSELLGGDMIGIDEEYLTLGLGRAAAAEASRLSPESSRMLERYAAGVNARIAAQWWWALGPEFALLRDHPRPWTPVDSLAIAKLMAWRLCENHRAELLRAKLVQKFGAGDAAALMGGYPHGGPVIVPAGAAGYRDVPLPALAADAWPFDDHGRRGSNSWVLSPARATGGRPLLANDPHLSLELPSIWYEQHATVRSDPGSRLSVDVEGAAIPGLPLVVIGHNQRVAWGLTNTGADVQDLYIERIDPVSQRYLYQGRWLPLKIVREDIPVRGRSQPIAYEIRQTRHGPIFVEQQGRSLALRWDSLDQGDITGAFWGFATSANWGQFTAAASRFAVPSQNLVYADVDGNIGYLAAGSVPVRTRGDGSVPVPGWTGEYEWSGDIPFDRMPRAFNPASGAIVTANNRIAGDGYPFHLTGDWMAPFRADRITGLLAARERFDVMDLARVQGDVESRAADRILKPLDLATPAARADNPAARDAVARVADRLRIWDRRVDGGSTAALYEVYASWLWRRTFADDMDDALFREYADYIGQERFGGLYTILDNPHAHWWDDLATIDRVETREDIEAVAMEDAVTWLRRRFDDPARWRWDQVHQARFTHVLGRSSGPLAWLFTRGPIPLGGDGSTIDNAMFVESRRPDDDIPFRVVVGSSYRQVLDVGDWDRSIGINAAGESGHPLSPHYFDQNPLWREGRYHPLPFTPAAVQREAASHLILKPR